MSLFSVFWLLLVAIMFVTFICHLPSAFGFLLVRFYTLLLCRQTRRFKWFSNVMCEKFEVAPDQSARLLIIACSGLGEPLGRVNSFFTCDIYSAFNL
ncbi:MAG: hypothetical protein ACWA5K_09220 [bacterium]